MRAYAPILLLLAVLLGGCGSLQADYVRADESTYKTVGKEWLRYVEADKALSTAQKQRRRRKAKAWKARLDAALQSLEKK